MQREVVLAVHMHCYQPPREEPTTGLVPRQPTAAPFHDWNERVAAECYRPNAFARILGDDGLLVSLVNNYAHVSFNVGPTLLSWLEDHEPATYQRMIEADRAGANGMAQAYNHMILPLAVERDVRTQVRWGLADFRHHFGRDADGMWLPETAVNEDVLRVLCEEGVRFTILAPTQALQFRPFGTSAWSDVSDGSIDTSRPYRWVHPDGDERGLDIVFYEGSLSRAVAFDPDAVSSQALVARSLAAAAGGGLVCVAADGETFGHHRKWVDRALAYALTVEAPRCGVRVASVAQYLREQRPEHQVQVQESAWSCAHGVGRWARDCGCSTGGEPGENQRWRAPLRVALDRLRDFNVEVFERRGAEVLSDPWAARDAYVEVVIGRTSREAFATHWITAQPDVAFTLLEAQHQAMLMYTSCGWFFHDLAGIETVQILRHAHRVMALLTEAGERPPRDDFLAVLGEATSNDRRERDGRSIWRHHVEPVESRLERDRLELDAARLATDVTAHERATVAARLPVLADLVEHGGDVPARLRRVVDDACHHALDDAVSDAVMTGTPESVSTALATLDLARRVGAEIDLEPAQETVYEALLGGLDVLRPLGAALGLAVDSLGRPR